MYVHRYFHALHSLSLPLPSGYCKSLSYLLTSLVFLSYLSLPLLSSFAHSFISPSLLVSLLQPFFPFHLLLFVFALLLSMYYLFYLSFFFFSFFFPFVFSHSLILSSFYRIPSPASLFLGCLLSLCLFRPPSSSIASFTYSILSLIHLLLPSSRLSCLRLCPFIASRVQEDCLILSQI